MTLAVSPRLRKPARLLPELVQVRLRRAVRQALGGVLGVVTLLLAAMLISFDPADPSFNTGSSGSTRNWLGGFGASSADLLLQGLGWTAWLLPLVLAAWSLQLVMRQDYRLSRRQTGKAALGLLLVALGAAILQLMGSDGAAQLPLAGGTLGALAGSGLLALAGSIGLPQHLAGTLLAIAALAPAGVLLVMSLGLSRQDWKTGGGRVAAWTRSGGNHGAALMHSAGSKGAEALGGAARSGASRMGTFWQAVLAQMVGAYHARMEAMRVDPLAGMGAPDVSIAAMGKVVPRIDLPDAAPAADEDDDDPAARYGHDRRPAAAVQDDDTDDAPEPVAEDEDLDLAPPPPAPPRPATVTAEHWSAPQVTSYAHGTPTAPPEPDAGRARLGVKNLLRRRPAAPLPDEDGLLPGAPGSAGFELPALDLLAAAPRIAQTHDMGLMQERARELEAALSDYGVRGAITGVQPGPVVTLYELEPAPGTKAQRVIGLADDIARTMCAASVRIATVPGRNVIGIELPNKARETVYLRSLLEAREFLDNTGKLALALGKDIGGAPCVTDLARMPHLLVAGTTGSGKSVGINTMICSLLYRLTPEQCRFIMIDPKMVELSIYEGIPHLLAPVVTEPKKAVVALKWAVREMEQRYRLLQRLSVRNIDGYNDRIRVARDNGEVLNRRVQTGFDPDTGRPVMEEQAIELKELPYIVVIIDEMADLMMIAGKDIEASVQRLAQMARAVGIHLITATQRPSVDVITGTIKANFPTRISFAVTSKIDSRTILGEQGAEQLLGQGDMLFMANGSRITRVHGPFVSDSEVEHIVRHLKAQGLPDYIEAVTEAEDEDGDEDGGSANAGGSGDEGEDLYDRAVAMVARERKCSTSFVQRQFSIGYNRAAKLVERMEKEGVVGPANHAGKREVLVRSHERETV